MVAPHQVIVSSVLLFDRKTWPARLTNERMFHVFENDCVLHGRANLSTPLRKLCKRAGTNWLRFGSFLRAVGKLVQSRNAWAASVKDAEISIGDTGPTQPD